MAKSAKHHKPAMTAGPEAPPGIERDNKGKAIPVKHRLPEDQAKVHRASKKKKQNKK